MERKYKFNVTMTYNYYGYPQSKQKFMVESSYLKLEVTHYGNQGHTIPVDYSRDRTINGYFWDLQVFMRYLYKTSYGFRSKVANMREGEIRTIELDWEGNEVQ